MRIINYRQIVRSPSVASGFQQGQSLSIALVDQVSILTKQGKRKNYHSFDFGLRVGAGPCQSEQGWIEDIHEVSLNLK